MVSRAAGETLSMQQPTQEHGPSDLNGPVRGTHGWWQGLGDEPLAAENPESSVSVKRKPRGKRRRDRTIPPERQELIDRVRGEIAAGTYDSQEKWEAALDRLLERLDGE
jgi:hypothetical protein